MGAGCDADASQFHQVEKRSRRVRLELSLQAPMLKARFTIPTAKVLVDRIVAEAEEIIERRLSSMICA
jgi:hypothetical protein